MDLEFLYTSGLLTATFVYVTVRVRVWFSRISRIFERVFQAKATGRNILCATS